MAQMCKMEVELISDVPPVAPNFPNLATSGHHDCTHVPATTHMFQEVPRSRQSSGAGGRGTGVTGSPKVGVLLGSPRDES